MKSAQYLDNLQCWAFGPASKNRLAHLFFDHVCTATIDHKRSEDEKEYQNLRELLRPLNEHRFREGGYEEIRPIVSATANTLTLYFPKPVFLWNPNDFAQQEIITESNDIENQQVTITESNGIEKEPVLSLSNIPMISELNLTNEQVFELNKDVGNKIKIRRLRKFFYENYQDKPLSYIEDDLMVRLDDFKLASKKHDLDIYDTTLSIAGTNKILVGAMGGLTSALSGLPLKESIAIGLTATIGSTALKVRSQLKRKSIARAENPISYLIDLNEKSVKNSNR